MEKAKLAVTDIEQPIAELAQKLVHRTLVIWAADCAGHVLPCFEDKHPQDRRPREAIEAACAWVRGEMSMTEARRAAFAAHAAARDADEPTSRAAARAAGHAAATAHVAGHAVHAATYAATAAGLAAGSADGAAKERGWQYQHLLELAADSARS